jgi:hypothetical protein
LLLGQQALALGVDAGVTVSNQATVAYDVASVIQTPIESDPLGNSTPGAGNPTEFLVDRRVDFSLIASDLLATQVTPGDLQAIAAFVLVNESNAIMDWDLSVADLGLGNDTNGFIDTGDLLVNYQIRVANGDGAAGVPVFATDLPYVDELIEDEPVVIYVYADVPLALTNGAIDNFTLSATAADDAGAVATPGVLDGLLSESAGADDPTVIDSVFANPSGADGLGNATESDDDGYEVVSAELLITKTAAVFSAPFGSDKALPDAVIEYTVLIDNSLGLSIAENVVVTDTVQIAEVVLEDEAYGALQDVAIDAGFCNADPGDGDTDGCAYDPVTGALSIDVPDIAIGATTTITYQVRISAL